MNRMIDRHQPEKGLKNYSLMTKLFAVFLILSLVVVILISVAIIFWGNSMSIKLAEDPAYADIKHMRLPVLIMCVSVWVLFIIACLIAIPFLFRVMQRKFYTKSSILMIRMMGCCFYLMILPAVILYFYTKANVAGSITNLWVFFGAFIALVVGSLFMLVANLMNEGQLYKDEVDLTV